MDKYTFLTSWDEAISIDQFKANSLSSAVEKWSKKLDLRTFLLNADMQDELIESSHEDEIVPLNGADNVWCISPMVGDAVLIVHIVKTK